MKNNRKNRKLQAIRKKNALRAGKGWFSFKASFELTNHHDSWKFLEEHKQDAIKRVLKNYLKYEMKILGTEVRTFPIQQLVEFLYRFILIKKLHREPPLNSMDRYFRAASERQRIELLNEMNKDHRDSVMNWISNTELEYRIKDLNPSWYVAFDYPKGSNYMVCNIQGVGGKPFYTPTNLPEGISFEVWCRSNSKGWSDHKYKEHSPGEWWADSDYEPYYTGQTN